MYYLLGLADRTKWPTVVALVILLVATALNWYWVWAILFLYWSIAGIVMRQVFIVQTVLRDEHPILFWSISIMWLVLAILTLTIEFFPALAVWLGWFG